MVYNIKDFGAIGNGVDFDTYAIQAALDKCHSNGGGKVVVEPGVYLTKTVYIKSNVNLYLSSGAVIQGSSDPNDYDSFTASGFYHEKAPENTTKCLISASGASNIAITGSGEINGAGPSFYNTTVLHGEFYSKPDIERPRMLILYECCDVKLEGVLFKDSPCWTVWLIACEDVHIDSIKIRGDQKMINNDGVDIDSCRNVTISNSIFRTGDDSIVIRAIQNMRKRLSVCENITVSNCILDSSCQGIRLGCPSDYIIRNCTFSNIVITGARNGIVSYHPECYLDKEYNIRMELYNILFSNITIDVGLSPVQLQIESGIRLSGLSGITFTDMRIKGNESIQLSGNEETSLSDIVFSNIKAEINSSKPLQCSYCHGIKMDNVELWSQV